MILTTTGTVGTVTIVGLRSSDNLDVQLTHPETINLLDFYSIEDIQAVLGAIQTQIAAGTITAQTQDGDPIADVNEVFEDTSQLSSDIDALESSDASQNTAIADLQSNSANQADLTQAEADIDALEVEQTTQDTNISQNASDITSEAANRAAGDASLLGQIQSNDSEIAAVEGVNTAQDTQIASLTGVVSGNTAAIANNGSDISSLQASQATQDTSIAQNATDIDTEEVARIAADQAHVDAPDPHPQYLLELPDKVLRFPPPTPATAGVRYTPIVNAAGDDYEFFREYMDFARRVTPLAHQPNTSFQEYLTLNAVVPEDGDYELTVSYRWSMNTAGSNFLAHVLFNGDFIFPLHIEPADSAGDGEIVPTSDGGTVDTGTDQFQRVSHEDIFTLAAGPQTFLLEFRGEFAFAEPTIYEALIKLKRVRRG